MKASNAQLTALRDSWKRARSARPSELDFTPFGFPGAKATDFDALFDQWSKALEAVVTATKPGNLVEERVVDVIVVRALRDAKGQVDATASNGFGWLLQSSPFLQKLAEAQVAMAPVIERRFRLRKELLQLAKEEMIDGVLAVERAAPLAKAIVETQKAIEAKASDVSDALDEATAASSRAKADSNSINEILQQAAELRRQLDQSKTDFEAVVTQVKNTADKTQEEFEQIETRRASADKILSEGQKLISQANEKLRKALADINQQGLSDSFAAKAKELAWERRWWIAAFLSSIAWLGLVAAHFAGLLGVGGTPTVATSPPAPFWIDLVKALPLAAPAIWLGWLAAKHVGLTARVRQDYNYKVAMSLALQGFKKEAQATGDEAMAKQLMEIAIRNFGENPVRIYEGKAEDGHPAERITDLAKKVVEVVEKGLSLKKSD